MRKLFTPSLLRTLVSRNVLVSVLALVVITAVAIYESNERANRHSRRPLCTIGFSVVAPGRARYIKVRPRNAVCELL